MKKKWIKKTVSFLTITTVAGMLLIGCGSGVQGAPDAAQTAAGETSDTVPAAPYFTKGVYANYSGELDNPVKTYFYIFSDDTYGYTEDGANGGIGLPFDIEQKDGSVSFQFGGADEAEETLLITAVKDMGILMARRTGS